MTAVTAAPETTAGRRPSWLTGTLPRTTVLAGVLGAAVTTAGAVALRAAGVPLAVHGQIPLAGFAQLTFLAAVLGGVLLAVLADTTASKIALAGLHLLAAASIIPALARRAG